MGVLTGFIFLPNLSYGKCQARWRTCMVCICIPVVIVIFIVSLIAFYYGAQTQWCTFCLYLDCIPVLSWCQTIG